MICLAHPLERLRALSVTLGVVKQVRSGYREVRVMAGSCGRRNGATLRDAFR